MNGRILIALAGLVAAACRTSPLASPPPAPAGGGIPAAVERLAAPDTRDGARDALAAAGAAAIPDLAHRAADADPAVRFEVAGLLGIRGAAEAVAPLAERAVEDEVAQVRWRALASLVALELPERAVAALLPSLASFDPTTRWRGAIALAMFEERAALPVLHEGALSPDPYRRLEAITALGQVHDARTADVLRPLLGSPSENDRKEVVFALGRIGGPAAEALLLSALDDPMPDVRARATLALGRAGTKASLQRLRTSARSDADSRVRERAGEAIRRIENR